MENPEQDLRRDSCIDLMVPELSEGSKVLTEARIVALQMMVEVMIGHRKDHLVEGRILLSGSFRAEMLHELEKVVLLEVHVILYSPKYP